MVLKSGFALPLDATDLAIYQQCTGRENPPTAAPLEVYTIFGRCGGKSFISALTAVYVGCFGSYKRYLNAGEHAVVWFSLVIVDQAKIVFNYVAGLLRAIPPLYRMIEVERADEIALNNGVTVMVKTSDYRAIRGLTVRPVSLTKSRSGIQAAYHLTVKCSLPCARRCQRYPAASY